MLIAGGLSMGRESAPLIIALSILPLLSLTVGFWTPIGALLSCVIQVIGFVHQPHANPLHNFLSILGSGIVGVLGPGAYSLDAYFYGRKLIKIPPRGA